MNTPPISFKGTGNKHVQFMQADFGTNKPYQRKDTKMIIELNGHRYREEEHGHFEAALIDGATEIAHTGGDIVLMFGGILEDVRLWAESYAIDKIKILEGAIFEDENGTYYTELELRASFEELKASGDTDCPTFPDYVKECCGKNGTLTKIERS